jgi:hypothetical protein
VNAVIDRRSRLQLRYLAGAGGMDDLSRRIESLEHEWDFDRVLETEASLMGLAGLSLAFLVHRGFLAIPGAVAAMVLLHGTHGWYPLLPLFRRLGVRTRNEIDQERYALKAIRGDFHALPPAGSAAEERATAAWEAVCA